MNKRKLLFCVLGGAAVLSSAGIARAESAAATSAVFRVNSVRSGERKSASPFAVGYSPDWSVSTPDPSAEVVIRKVEHADTHQASTSIVQRCAAGASGTLQLDADALGFGNYRLLHDVEVGGNRVGETLASDVAVGVESPASASTLADSRTNSLQCVAESGEIAPLTYATSWVTNGTPAQVVLTKVCDRYRRGVLQESVTTELFRTSAPADGVFNFRPESEQGGTFTLSCAFLDAGGNLLDVGEAFYRFKEKWGLLLMLR